MLFVVDNHLSAISVDRLSSSRPLHCRSLNHDSSTGEPATAINSVEFSNDGSLFVSGGDDGSVVLWPINRDVQGKWKPTSTTIMKPKEHNYIVALAVSPDNQRVFSGGYGRKVFVHDINMYVQLIGLLYLCSILPVFMLTR